MKSVHQIRYENMVTVASYFRTRRDFAFAANITPQQVSQLINQPAVHKIGSKIAKRIEQGAGKPEGWLDIDHQADLIGELSISVIVETTTTLHQILKRHGISTDNVSDDTYQRLLRDALLVTSKAGTVCSDQIQSKLFSGLLTTLTE